MSHPQLKICLGVLALACSWPVLAGAEPAGPATVTSTGSVELKRQADVLRVQVEIVAKGKDLKEALAKLKERREAVRTRLGPLGALKDSVEFSDPAVTSEKSERQLQMEQMMMQRMRGPGKKPPTKDKPSLAAVATLLKVDFPIKAANPDDYLIAAQQLQDKIKSADLGGLKELAKMSPQEEELSEEFDGAPSEFSGVTQPKRGEATFLFISKIPEAERDKAMAEAFQKARLEAARLAKAAGAELGALHQLANQNQLGMDMDDNNNLARFYGYPGVQPGRQQSISVDVNNGEAGGAQPGKVTMRITVSASFRLKTAADK